MVDSGEELGLRFGSEVNNLEAAAVIAVVSQQVAEAKVAGLATKKPMGAWVRSGRATRRVLPHGLGEWARTLR